MVGRRPWLADRSVASEKTPGSNDLGRVSALKPEGEIPETKAA